MILRSIGAVLAGIALGIVLSIGSDMLLRALGVFPPLGRPMSDPLFVLAAGHRTVYGVLGSYLTARLAPSRPMLHAMVLGSLGLAANIAGAAVARSRPDLGPLWYPLALVVLALPCAWMGAWLYQRRAASSAS